MGNLLAWFENYLYKRHQKVSVNNTSSSFKFVTAGVPQGSVLGPILFLIYVNDISDSLTGIARFFADDTWLSFFSIDPAEIERILTQILANLSLGLKSGLNCFMNKDKRLITSNIYYDYIIKLVMDDILLKTVETCKHLGIVLSSKHKWSARIGTLIESAAIQVSFLRKLEW